MEDLVLESDLHLGAGYDRARGMCDEAEGFFYDRSFSAFVDHLLTRADEERRPWRLVLLGDVFDFRLVDIPPPSRSAVLANSESSAISSSTRGDPETIETTVGAFLVQYLLALDACSDPCPDHTTPPWRYFRLAVAHDPSSLVPVLSRQAHLLVDLMSHAAELSRSGGGDQRGGYREGTLPRYAAEIGLRRDVVEALDDLIVGSGRSLPRRVATAAARRSAASRAAGASLVVVAAAASPSPCTGCSEEPALPFPTTSSATTIGPSTSPCRLALTLRRPQHSHVVVPGPLATAAREPLPSDSRADHVRSPDGQAPRPPAHVGRGPAHCRTAPGAGMTEAAPRAAVGVDLEVIIA